MQCVHRIGGRWALVGHDCIRSWVTIASNIGRGSLLTPMPIDTAPVMIARVLSSFAPFPASLTLGLQMVLPQLGIMLESRT